jgi:hypothetical protein
MFDLVNGKAMQFSYGCLFKVKILTYNTCGKKPMYMHKCIMANPPMEGIRNRTINKETYMQKREQNHTIS